MTQQSDWVPSSVDLEVPSAARMYDYMLGGNHNFEIDREFTKKALQIQPEGRRIAIMNRSFLRRVVLFLVDQGVRQFLDLGSGIPTVGNVHEIAQQADPLARVVYVDKEHIAVAHSQLLLKDNDSAAVVHADITNVSDVLEHEQTTRLLDFSEPIGLLAVTIGHYILDDQDPQGVFAAYRDALPSGSYLAVSHLASDFQLIKEDEVTDLMRKSQNNIQARGRDEIMALFGDFELVEPGLVTTSHWHPERDSDPAADHETDGLYAGVARKG